VADRYALLIGTSDYNDEKLARLKTPVADLEVLAGLLRDEVIGGYQVNVLPNKPFLTILREIVSFLKDRKRDDLVLLYFSGHGVLDEGGNLYLATQDTESDLLSATALSSKFVKDEMDKSRSKRQVLILDCCHSGAFLRGTKGAGPALTQETFEGYGRAVLTASDSVQYALEGDQVSSDLQLSLFTHFLAEGIRTGEADLDSDDWIELDEWFDYASRKVREHTHVQTPRKYVDNQYGELFIARSPKAGVIRPAEISPKLRARLKSEYLPDRQEAVEELKGLLESDDDPAALAALTALEKVAKEDDSGSIRRRARAILADSAARMAELNAKAESRSAEPAGLAHQRGEAEKKAAEEQRRREELARLAAQKAEEERLARERDEQARLAAQKAEAERKAKEKEKAARLAREREKQAKLAAQKTEEERLARVQEEKARRAAQKTRAASAIQKEVEKPSPRVVFKPPSLRATLSDHKETVTCLAFSPDGGELASGALSSDRIILGDQTIRVWGVSEASLSIKFNHRKGTYGLVFIQGGARLASIGEGGWLHLWDASSGRLLWKRNDVQFAATTAMYSPDRSSLVMVDEPHVRILNVGDGETHREVSLGGISSGLLNRKKPVISADGNILVSVDVPNRYRRLGVGIGLSGEQDPDAVVKVWRLTDGKQIGNFKLSLKPEPVVNLLRGFSSTRQQSDHPEMSKPGVICFDLSPDGKILAVGLENAQVLLLSIPDGKLLAVLGKSAGLPKYSFSGSKIHTVAFSPAQGFLVAAMGAEFRYWSVPTGDLLHSQKVDYSPTQVVFSPTGKQIACTVGSDIKLWAFSP
jgi:WD40 repeat protein